ncbi:MAG: molybdopterin oxidoreductase [Planctomycetota bacterium]|nr:MAG: molybdopterin oxidoreductase [Planctomycetota bacterium]
MYNGSLELPILDQSPRVCGVKAPAPSLLAYLLADQQQLTAVEQFAIEHVRTATPVQARYYESLLPATPPGPGQQYAFEVDLDRCSGCKACVTACHTLNGLDDHETWRDVGLLVGGTAANPLMQHVTTACHHCLEPACMEGCPVDAYVKDPVTGIVKHLDDQCIGCQYCTLACPYEVPKYHAGKGIVRKCDMCSNRLAVGEAPACVQACPHQAIAIRIVDIAQVIEDCEVGQFLPAAPDPHLTHPTTHYKSSSAFPRNTLPADYHQTAPQHPHWPLILMLVLTQLSVGAFTAGQVASQYLEAEQLASLLPTHAGIALAMGLLALAASTFHLGRPQYAFRAVIGLRHSWLSREIVAFGIFAKTAMLYAGMVMFRDSLPVWLIALTSSVGWAVVVSGLFGVFCSVMIYAATRREFWRFDRTLRKFGLTSILLGTATFWMAVAWSESSLPLSIVLAQIVAGVALFKLLSEAVLYRALLSPHVTTLGRSARLHVGPLARVALGRNLFGIVGGVVLPWLAWSQGGTSSPLLVTTSLTLLLIGELLERYLYFAAVASPRMPGAVRS